MNNASIINEIVRLLETADYDDYDRILESNGFEIISDDINESISPYSTDVEWESTIIVKKDSETYSIILEGTAIAEISYERWTETYGYTITDYKVYEK